MHTLRTHNGCIYSWCDAFVNVFTFGVNTCDVMQYQQMHMAQRDRCNIHNSCLIKQLFMGARFQLHVQFQVQFSFNSYHMYFKFNSVSIHVKFQFTSCLFHVIWGHVNSYHIFAKSHYVHSCCKHLAKARLMSPIVKWVCCFTKWKYEKETDREGKNKESQKPVTLTR